MEIFIEEMVKAKKDLLKYLQTTGIIVLTAVLVFAIFFILMPMFSAFSSLILLLAAGIVYGAYVLITLSNVEYEYSLVNTEIDVDKIVNRSRRKRLASASIRTLEAFGTKRNPDYEKYVSNSLVTKVYACRDKSADDVFFMVYNHGDKKMMLVFNPSQKIIEHITKFNPRKPLI